MAKLCLFCFKPFMFWSFLLSFDGLFHIWKLLVLFVHLFDELLFTCVDAKFWLRENTSALQVLSTVNLLFREEKTCKTKKSKKL